MNLTVCLVFTISVIQFFLSIVVDDQVVMILLLALMSFWMIHGYQKLVAGGWRSSYGRQTNAVWLFKDSLAIFIWPIMYRWIVHRGEMEK